MRFHGRFGLPRWVAALPLLLTCGCAFHEAFGFLTTPDTAQPPPPAPMTTPLPAAPAAPIMPLNLVSPESPQDHISLLSEKLAAYDDDRKLLAARLADVDAQLREKERALNEAKEEIVEANQEVLRTRADLQRWRQEILELREKLRHAEKESMTNLETIIKMLEKLEKEQGGEGFPIPPRLPPKPIPNPIP